MCQTFHSRKKAYIGGCGCLIIIALVVLAHSYSGAKYGQGIVERASAAQATCINVYGVRVKETGQDVKNSFYEDREAATENRTGY
jgi:hypothetical protein